MTTTIKAGLKSILALNKDQYERLQQVIEPLVHTISKMLRSSSIALLYHLTALVSEGRTIPNLYKQKDTYWKNWLRFRADTGVIPIALEDEVQTVAGSSSSTISTQSRVNDDVENDEDEEDDDEEDDDEEDDDEEDENDGVQKDIPAVVMTAKTGDGLFRHFDKIKISINVLPDDKVSLTFLDPSRIKSRYFSFGGGNVDSNIIPGFVFDQVVAYAAGTLKTAVINNAWVTLIPTLSRLAKAMTNSMDKPSKTASGAKVTAQHVMTKIRGEENPVYEPGSNWHPKLVEFISEVRTRLGLSGDSYLFDEYFKPSSKKVTFTSAFLFRCWMLKQFRLLKQRGIKLSPVFDVSRAHIRLDRKILTHVAMKTFESSDNMAAIIGELRELMRLLKTKDADGNKLLLNPKKFLPKRPRTVKPKDKKDKVKMAEWKKNDDALKKKWEMAVEERKRQHDYVAMEKTYKRYIDLQTSVISSMFKDGGKRRGWKFNGSIMTDGVSSSTNYSKFVVKNDSTNTKDMSSLLGKMAKNGDVVSVEPDDKYDKGMSSLVSKSNKKKVLHAAVDPGLVQIASVSYHLNEKDRQAHPLALHTKKSDHTKQHEHGWSLSGAEYRKKSGIKKEDEWKNHRYRPLHQAWQEMGRTSSLKTLDVGDIESYLEQYLQIETKWWSLALSRRESRSKLQRYIGKRSVLDSFFSNVDKELKRIFPNTTILLAYGSAVSSMKKTGKNVMATPTTAAYKSAKRIFGDRCHLQDEYGSTKYDFETGDTKEAVYRTSTKGNVEHVTGKTMPSASVDKYDLLNKLWKDISDRKKKRHGGRTKVAPPVEKEEPSKETQGYRQRYPEVRGLRYLPSKRIYVGRDFAAAKTIARLSAYRQIKGVAKIPAPFCKKRRLLEVVESDIEEGV